MSSCGGQGAIVTTVAAEPMFKRLIRPLYHTLYRSLVRFRCYWEDWLADNSDLPPAMLRFHVSESISEEVLVAVGQNARTSSRAFCVLGGQVRRMKDYGF